MCYLCNILQKKDRDEDSDEEREIDDEEIPVGSKVVKVTVSSIRLDAIAKTGFGMSRKYAQFYSA